MKKRGFYLALPVLLIWSSFAKAEPYLAAWKGVNCDACHVNQTGGWLRNDFGKNYGKTLKTFDWQALSDASEKIKENTPTWASFGIDLHESYTVSLPHSPGFNESSFNQDGNSKLYPSRQSFSIAVRANDVISGVFTYRLDEGAPNEVYGLISDLPAYGYLKLGKFMVPYGLTLSDDNSLVRAPLNGAFSFDAPNPDGLEFGFYPGNLFLNAALVNGALRQESGPAGYNEKIFSAKGGVNFRQWTLGGSVYGENLDLDTRKIRYGAYGWTKLGGAVVLAEYDRGYDGENGTGQVGAPVNRSDYQAYHASVEFDLGNAVYLRLANEWLDDSQRLNSHDGWRNVASLRCYPVEDLKLQVDLARMDTVFVVNNPDYNLVADAMVFY